MCHGTFGLPATFWSDAQMHKYIYIIQLRIEDLFENDSPNETYLFYYKYIALNIYIRIRLGKNLDCSFTILVSMHDSKYFL